MRHYLPMRRFRVAETSMRPALEPGDRLLVWTWARPGVGDLAVFREPNAALTFAVKRVFKVGAQGELWVRGDNPNVSRDSRTYGAVPRALIVGKAIYRYLPGARRGLLSAAGR